MVKESEQNYYNETASGIENIRHDSIGLLKWMTYFYRYYENTYSLI